MNKKVNLTNKMFLEIFVNKFSSNGLILLQITEEMIGKTQL